MPACSRTFCILRIVEKFPFTTPSFCSIRWRVASPTPTARASLLWLQPKSALAARRVSGFGEKQYAYHLILFENDSTLKRLQRTFSFGSLGGSSVLTVRNRCSTLTTTAA